MNIDSAALKCFTAAALAINCYLPSIVNAGGFIGDLVNRVAPGAGTKLDEIHAQVKEAIPPYKAIEEGTTKTVNEAFVQTGAPALQELIARSRDDAVRNGVQPIPPDIRNNLSGFLSDDILNAARYRIQGGGDLTLQVNSIRYGEARAITLDYVIVFKDENDALYNPTLWAHELTHLGQYQRWGIRDFSIRYLRDYQAVEREAYEAETRYVAWVGLQNTQKSVSNGETISPTATNHPVYSFSGESNTNTCGTVVTSCQMNGSAPVGTPCWCNTPWGAAAGSLIPGNSRHDPREVAQPNVLANACATQLGSCPLGVSMSVGSQCACFTPQGNFPGIAQQRSIGSMCSTPAGACPLGMPLFSGDTCYCPTPMGPIWGQVP